MKEKLNGKDLINIGIFSAIYFVIVFITAMLGMVPILYPMLTVICPLVGGVVYMLFLTKVKKFGMIWIMSILMGILMLISGMSWYALAIGVFSGLIADLIFKSGNYGSSVKGVRADPHHTFTDRKAVEEGTCIRRSICGADACIA